MPSASLVPFGPPATGAAAAAPSAGGPGRPASPLRDYPDGVLSAAARGDRAASGRSIPAAVLLAMGVRRACSPGKPEDAQRRAGSQLGCPRPALPTTPAPWPLGRVVGSPCPCRWGHVPGRAGKGAGARDGDECDSWITKSPQTPRVQLWSRRQLWSALLERFALVIVDEAPSCRLVPGGEGRFTDPVLLADHSQSDRDPQPDASCFAIAGLATGLRVSGAGSGLKRFGPPGCDWPVNGAGRPAVVEAVVGDRRWQERVRRLGCEGGPVAAGQLLWPEVALRPLPPHPIFHCGA